MNDAELIKHLGGPTKVAALLSLEKDGGVQRVQNWMTRGIPSKVKLDHPNIFLRPEFNQASVTTDHESASTSPTTPLDLTHSDQERREAEERRAEERRVAARRAEEVASEMARNKGVA